MTSALDSFEATLADVPIADRVASPSKGLNGVNGVGHGSPRTSIEGDGKDEAERFRRELERVKREKDELSSQYNSLVARLNTMRNTLGNKLKQDAVSRLPNLALQYFHIHTGGTGPKRATHSTADSAK